MKGGATMITLTMSEDEAKLLDNLFDRYLSHLEVEIVRTHRREFRDALKERKEALVGLSERLKKLTG